jgi:hypothetical protein
MGGVHVCFFFMVWFGFFFWISEFQERKKKKKVALGRSLEKNKPNKIKKRYPRHPLVNSDAELKREKTAQEQ